MRKLKALGPVPKKTSASKRSAAPKPKRSFKDIFAKYPRYDTSQGFGNPAQWKAAFEERMGIPEAKSVLRGRGPRGVLGVSQDATWDEIRKAFRRLALEHHPDRAVDKEAATKKFKDVAAAYAILAEEFGQ
jgi:hypothetical protein